MPTTQITRNYMRQTILTVKTNGGSITIEKKVGDDWVVTDRISADGGYLLQLGSSETRITPSGGAAFEVTQ